MLQARLPRVLQPFKCDDLIRLGNDSDGGYIACKSDVFAANTLLSFGVGEDVSFERGFAKLNDCEVLAFDKSVSGVHEDFFVGNRQHIEKHIHEDVSFAELINDYQGNVFLKSDIDGAEYDILVDLINNSHKLTGLVIEFHFITEKDHFERMMNFVSKVDLKLVHVHANNYAYFYKENECMPSFLELAFSSSSEVVFDPRLELPHELDHPNNPERDEIQIVF